MSNINSSYYNQTNIVTELLKKTKNTKNSLLLITCFQLSLKE